MITIRHSLPKDLDAIIEIFHYARQFMKEHGNPNQWINGYPSVELILREITNGTNYVCENENGEITGALETRELTSNINKEERKQGIKTNVVPIVYQGKRSSLGEEKDDLSLVPEDKKIVDTIFEYSLKKPAPKRKRQ